jgi:hypothetical protein
LRLSESAVFPRNALHAHLARKEWLGGVFRGKGMKGHEGQRNTGQGAQPMPSKGMKGINTQPCPSSCPPMPLLHAPVKIERASVYKSLVTDKEGAIMSPIAHPTPLDP